MNALGIASGFAAPSQDFSWKVIFPLASVHFSIAHADVPGIVARERASQAPAAVCFELNVISSFCGGESIQARQRATGAISAAAVCARPGDSLRDGCSQLRVQILDGATIAGFAHAVVPRVALRNVDLGAANLSDGHGVLANGNAVVAVAEGDALARAGNSAMHRGASVVVDRAVFCYCGH